MSKEQSSAKEKMPDAYLADDPDSFENLFFIGGTVAGLAIVLPQVCAVSVIFKDDQAAILNNLKEACSFRVWFNGAQKPVTSSYQDLSLARAERNALLVKLEKYTGGK